MTQTSVKPLVPREALEALDIRVGTIVLVEDVPKASRLVRLTVDFGDHRRCIVADRGVRFQTVSEPGRTVISPPWETVRAERVEGVRE